MVNETENLSVTRRQRCYSFDQEEGGYSVLTSNIDSHRMEIEDLSLTESITSDSQMASVADEDSFSLQKQGDRIEENHKKIFTKAEISDIFCVPEYRGIYLDLSPPEPQKKDVENFSEGSSATQEQRINHLELFNSLVKFMNPTEGKTKDISFYMTKEGEKDNTYMRKVTLRIKKEQIAISGASQEKLSNSESKKNKIKKGKTTSCYKLWMSYKCDRYICGQCYEYYDSVKNMFMHQYLRHKVRCFRCYRCDFQTDQIDSYATHFYENPTHIERFHFCRLCGFKSQIQPIHEHRRGNVGKKKRTFLFKPIHLYNLDSFNLIKTKKMTLKELTENIHYYKVTVLPSLNNMAEQEEINQLMRRVIVDFSDEQKAKNQEYWIEDTYTYKIWKKYDDGSFFCDHCSFSCMSAKAMIEHQSVEHKIRSFQCFECRFQTLINEEYSKHFINNPNHIKRIYYCELCGHKSTYFCFHTHRAIGPVGRDEKNSRYDYEVTALYRVKLIRYGKYFNIKNFFNSDEGVENGNLQNMEESALEKTIESNDNAKVVEIPTFWLWQRYSDGNFVCEKCPLDFKTAENIIMHQYEDHNMQQFMCHQCRFLTTCRIEYKNHFDENSDHIVKMHQCNLCGFKSTNRFAIHLHQYTGIVTRNTRFAYEITSPYSWIGSDTIKLVKIEQNKAKIIEEMRGFYAMSRMVTSP